MKLWKHDNYSGEYASCSVGGIFTLYKIVNNAHEAEIYVFKNYQLAVVAGWKRGN